MAQAPDITLTPARLAAFITAVFTAAGLDPEHAACVAASLTWAEQRGIPSHGIVRIPRYVELLDSGEMNRAAQPTIRQLAPAAFRLEADRAPGPVAMLRALDHAITLARSQGTGFGLVQGCTHTGAIGLFAERATEAGCAAIIAASGPPLMAYHGARIPSLATSPLAIALPGPAGSPPLLLDMASAALAMGRLRQMQAAGETLAPGLALAADGTPTTDPGAATIPLSVGGPKGSGLALLLEALTGHLAGAPILMPFLLGTDRTHRQNAMILAIDIATFRPLAEVQAEIGALAATIHDLPRQDGVEQLLLPGERGARMAQRRANAIPLRNPAWAALLATAHKLGVPSPS